MAENRYAVAIDVGATKVLCALVRSDGRIVSSQKEPTAKEDAASLVSQISRLIKDRNRLSGLDGSSIKGVGIAVPGIVESKTGVVVWAPNLPGWRDLPLEKMLREDFGIRIPVFVEDDRVTSILGEQWLGSARLAKNAAYIIIGTGIGAGILVEGKPYKGSMTAGAIGWMLLGRDFMNQIHDEGCLEHFASGPSIARRATEKVRKGSRTVMTAMANNDVDHITSEIVFEAAKQGDKVALDIVKETAQCLGIAVSNMVSILNPEIVVIGGGVGEASDLLLGDIASIVNSYSQPYAAKRVTIVRSALGGNASLLGCARLVFDRT